MRSWDSIQFIQISYLLESKHFIANRRTGMQQTVLMFLFPFIIEYLNYELKVYLKRRSKYFMHVCIFEQTFYETMYIYYLFLQLISKFIYLKKFIHCTKINK